MGKLVKYAFYAFLISIPFGTRILLYQFTTGFDEYEAVFLYASDILMVLFLAAFFWHRGRECYGLIPAGGGQARLSALGGNERMTILALMVFVLMAAVSIFLATIPGLAVYNFARLILLAITALAVGGVLRMGAVKFSGILAVLAGLAVIQSLVGILQFIWQEGLGLMRLGEPLIGPNVIGSAKIIAEGGKVLRAYGTLPHPNVFGAFMVVGLLAILYLWLEETNNKKETNESLDTINSNHRPIPAEGGQARLSASGGNKSITIHDALLAAGLFSVFLGLVFSFSRSAWLVAGLAMSLVIGRSLIVLEYRRRAMEVFAILLSIGAIFLFAFQSFIFPRAQISLGEPAVTQRISYNDIGFYLIKNNLLGVGIGNQVLYSVKSEVYKNAGMDQVWQWQPIHNIYLLMATEIGVVGLAAFLIFIFSILISGFLVVSRSSSVVLPVMLLALLLLGLFDHYLWTLQPGRLMLWLTIGLVIGLKADVSVGSPTPKGVGVPQDKL